MRKVIRNGLTFYQFERLVGQSDIVHGMFTRRGGVSVSPWASLNLSRSTGDSLEAISENNRRLLGALDLSPDRTVSAWLNHGNHAAVVGAEHGGTALKDTDALISAAPGVVLSMRFADCVPVLFHDAARHVTAMAHAGWPGVVAGILSATVHAMRDSFGCRPWDIWAGIGPAVRVECYQFGADLAERVVAACPSGVPIVHPQPDGTLHLDLIAAVKSQLESVGVIDIEDSGVCTACHTDEWFSHRVEKRTGRFGVVIGLR